MWQSPGLLHFALALRGLQVGGDIDSTHPRLGGGSRMDRLPRGQDVKKGIGGVHMVQGALSRRLDK